MMEFSITFTIMRDKMSDRKIRILWYSEGILTILWMLEGE